MTTATAADYLDCSVRQVQRLCKSRQLRSAWVTNKHGRRVLNVPYRDVRRWHRRRTMREVTSRRSW
jgi:helix-turn-helix protein